MKSWNALCGRDLEPIQFLLQPCQLALGTARGAGTAPAPLPHHSGNVCAKCELSQLQSHHSITLHRPSLPKPLLLPSSRGCLERSDPGFVSWLVCSCQQQQPSESKEIQSLAVPWSPLPCCRNPSPGWARSNRIQSTQTPSGSSSRAGKHPQSCWQGVGAGPAPTWAPEAPPGAGNSSPAPGARSRCGHRSASLTAQSSLPVWV